MGILDGKSSPIVSRGTYGNSNGDTGDAVGRCMGCNAPVACIEAVVSGRPATGEPETVSMLQREYLPGQRLEAFEPGSVRFGNPGKQGGTGSNVYPRLN
jgi:hypothetical protein